MQFLNVILDIIISSLRLPLYTNTFSTGHKLWQPPTGSTAPVQITQPEPFARPPFTVEP